MPYITINSIGGIRDKNLIVEMGCLTAGYSQKAMLCCFFFECLRVKFIFKK